MPCKHEEIKIVLEMIVKSIERSESKEKAWIKAIENFNYEEFKNMHVKN